MPRPPPSAAFVTHTVSNQAPPLTGFNAYLIDEALRDAVAREGGAWAEADLVALGDVAGGELLALAEDANRHKPQLRLFDRYGHRLDEVEFHPAYHRIMTLAVDAGVAGFAWLHQDRPGAHVARCALAFLHAQAEQGTGCPLTMTYASVPVLRRAPGGEHWVERIRSCHYDPRGVAMPYKTGVQIGMGMTEKQGGSDLRANTTRAHAVGGGAFELVGHKWFFSAPMCDAHLVLAQADEGPSCFLLPRICDDGTRNRVRIQRLKDKLGDWSNASAEVEFHGAHALPVGEPGRGIATLLEMVSLTRLDCMMGSAAIMRQALVQALHHARHRSAFGRPLIQQPLMRNVLADLALESEAATALTLRVARAVDASPRDPAEAAFARIATAIGKFWICKRCAPFVNEAQECLGGQGYVEESMLPRLYRQAPLNSIWEGSGNIQCLDVVRAATREPATLEALFAELARAADAHPAYDTQVVALRAQLSRAEQFEWRGRALAEQAACLLQASILLRAGPQAAADAFCASRLAAGRGQVFGTLGDTTHADAIIERAAPNP